MTASSILVAMNSPSACSMDVSTTRISFEDVCNESQARDYDLPFLDSSEW